MIGLRLNMLKSSPRHVATPVAAVDETPYTTADNKQAFLILGDSISQGASDGNGPTPVTGTVYEWYNSALVQVGAGDLQSTANGGTLGSQWPKFGIDYYNTTGKKPVLINRGSSGASYAFTGDTNNWLSTNTNWTGLLSNVTACLSNLGVSKLRGILIICGINDARRSSYTLASVETALNDLFSRLATNYPGVPVYVTNLGRSETGISDTRIDAIRTYTLAAIAAGANRKLAADLREYATNHPEYYRADLLHLNQSGCDVLGAQLATYAAANL